MPIVIQLLEHQHQPPSATLQIERSTTRINIRIGVSHIFIYLSTLFNLYLEKIIRNALERENICIKVIEL